VDLNITYGEAVDRVTNFLAEAPDSIIEGPDCKQMLKDSQEVVGPILLEN
jgi:hypothetical protein